MSIIELSFTLEPLPSGTRNDGSMSHDWVLVRQYNIPLALFQIDVFNEQDRSLYYALDEGKTVAVKTKCIIESTE